MKKSFGLKFFFLALCAQLTEACKIAGSDTGICTDPSDFDILLPFCKVVVQYRACLPRYQALWYNHTPILKDTYVAQMHKKLVGLRKLHESNKTFHKLHSDEWDAGTNSIVNRFSDNPDCVNAFRNYFCWMSFPRCDTDGSSLPLCRSVCENFFLACKQSKDLWRCGDTAFVNGYKPEKSTQLTSKNIVHYRALFPGSPFENNAFDPKTKKPLVVCTPSIENAASSRHPRVIWILGMLSVLIWAG